MARRITPAPARDRKIRKILIANRGEIAVRIARTIADMGIESVAVYSEDDANSLHTRMTDESVPMQGNGVRAYLDIERIVQAALDRTCQAVHPGYGFLSESAEFAAKCEAAGLIFIGPTTEQLKLLGDKVEARKLAERCGIPILPGTNGPTTAGEARGILQSLRGHGAIMLKAIAGGGGRGIRRVDRVEELDAAFDLCRLEALRAFENGALYVEQFVPRARHIEVQIIGDSSDAVSHLWDRECSLQRRNQKIVEIAPATGISEELRERLLQAAVMMARSVGYRNLGTFEFLLDASRPKAEHFVFLEANPRLQVEHTVTEEITGLDLVALQIGVADGRNLEELGVLQADVPRASGIAVQARINMETMLEDGTAKPAGGTLAVYEPPSGPGVRVDGFGYAGYRTSTSFDSLLAKAVVHVRSGRLPDAMRKAHRALCEFKIVGVPTNLSYLQRIVSMPQVRDGAVHTRYLEEHSVALASSVRETPPDRFFGQMRAQLAGSRIDTADPLSILQHGQNPSAGAGRMGKPMEDPATPCS